MLPFFSTFRLYLRLSVFVAACLGFTYLWFLPTSYAYTPSEELALLPDADLAAIADTHWANGYRDSAISVLRYSEDIKQADLAQDPNARSGVVASSPLHKQLLHEYSSSLADESSIDGRLWKLGSGAVTGEIDSWEAMAGSTVADLFVVGDIRDIIMQSFVVDDTDEFILTLSAVGIATTVWPPADPAISMLKAAQKSKSIADPIVNQISRAGKAYKNAPTLKNQQAFIQTVEPLWKLSSKCRSWSQFKLLLKHSDSLDTIRMLEKVMSHSPKTASQVNRIFSVCAHSNKHIGTVMKMLNKAGQKGCDAIYAVLRKGPVGVNWLAKHPTLLTRLGKIGYKDSNFAYNEALKNYGHSVVMARAAAMALCLFLAVYTSPLWWLGKKCLPKKKAIKNSETTTRSTPLSLRYKAVLLILVLSLCISAGLLTGYLHGPVMPSLSSEAPGKLATARQGTRELRCRLQEDDSIDPNDVFAQSALVPIIKSSDGSQWLVCTRRDLALLWPEITDGDISSISYLINKRGANPASAEIDAPIRLYKPYNLFCLIPCPPSMQTTDAQPPLQAHDLSTQPPLYYFQAHDTITGVQITAYDTGANIAVDIQVPAEHQPRFGDFVMTADGRLAGFFTGSRVLLHIDPDLHKQQSHIIRSQAVPGQRYYQQFVNDVRALP